ncbi:MAG: glycosyltransferase family 2 protein [Nitrospirae bacterium]|nr:glycosyltransferase family 2 protein [Nitrospirota bacterium]
MKPHLSIIMPAYNEGDVIFENLLKVDSVISKVMSDFEIIIVDDGSTDDTLKQAERAVQESGRIKIVHTDINYGKGNAFRSGVENSIGEYTALLDADLDLPPDQLLPMLNRLKEKRADIIIGSKYHEESRIKYPFTRKLMSRCYALLNKALFGMPLHDTQSGIKIFKRETLDNVLPLVKTKGYAFDIEILVNAYEKGAAIVEYPVNLDFRSKKHSSMPLKMAFDILSDTFRVWYLRKINR